MEHGENRNRVEAADVHEADLEAELLGEAQPAANAEAEIGRAVVRALVAEHAVVVDVDVRVEQAESTERVRLDLVLRRKVVLRGAHDAEDVDRQVHAAELRSEAAAVMREVRIAPNADGPVRAGPLSTEAERDAHVVRVVPASDAGECRPLRS